MKSIINKIRFSLVLVFSFSLLTVAQQPNLDSLYSVWEDPTQPDSIRVQALHDYIRYGYLFTHPDTALVLSEALHVYAKKHGYLKASAKAFNLQGSAIFLKGNYPFALEYYEKSILIMEELGDKNGVASRLNNIGNIYMGQSNYPRALEYYEKSFAIEKELGNKEGIANSLSNIGNTYKDQGNYPFALEYYQKALAINEKIGVKSGISTNLSNIGVIYDEQGDYPRALEYYKRSLAIEEEIGNIKGTATSLLNIGGIYSSQGEDTVALEYYKKALSINEKIGNKVSISRCLHNLASIYADQSDYPRALDYFQRSLTIKKELGDRYGTSASLFNIGVLYQRIGKYTLSLSYCQNGLALTEEIGALDLQKQACKCLYDAYKALGNSSKALEYYEKMIVARDSMFNEENTKKLVQIDMQYEFDQKEAAAKAEQDKKDAIALQEIRRQKLVRNGFMGGFAVVLLFAGVFFRQRNKIGKEKQRSEELLLNILPYEVAEELKEKGSAEAKLFDDATVLFTDFKGFTAMSETLSPRELVYDLNHCFSAFDRICGKYGIEKIKTIGDAYMAAGGLPTPNATHAKDVVKAALEICDFIEKGKADKIANNLPYFEIRIGIHTGPVVAGIVGVKKFQYDIWGDTVNTAARMESNGEVGKVNISQATYELLKNDSEFIFESRGKIEAKGKGEIEMVFVSANSKHLNVKKM